MSRTQSILARIAITIGAVGLVLLLRVDIAESLSGEVTLGVRKFKSPGIIRSYLHSEPVRKLQIGAGGNSKAGWLNSDIEPRVGQIYLDATKSFPLPDRSVRFVFSEAMFEHITYEQGLVMLKESYRVLEPGGVMRLSTPNLLRFTALIGDARTLEMEEFISQKVEWSAWPKTADPPCYILNLQLREWGHQFVYTPKLLRARLKEAGFKDHDIREVGIGQSTAPELRNLEDRAHWRVHKANAYEMMVFEAART